MKREKTRAPWIDTLAAIIAVYERLLVPVALLVIALLLSILLFRIFFL